jgi:hypothetical protein
VQFDQLLNQRQPDPAPLVRPSPGVLDPVKPLEQPGHFGGGNARAGVTHDEFDGATRSPQRHGDLALEGELEGIRQQVQDHLLPHFPVHEHRLGKGRAIHRQPQPGSLDCGSEHAGEFGSESGEVGRLVDGPDPPRLDAREVEQRIDQPEKAKTVAIHDFELTHDGGRQLRAAAVQQIFDGTEHERQRRAELVADVREKNDLGPVEFGQRLGPPPLILVRTGVGDGGGHAGGEQVVEAPVRLV